MGTIPVVDLTRECQYCYDQSNGVRVRCNRLAVVAHPIMVGKRGQITFRCIEHRGKRNDTILRFVNTFSRVVDTNFGLGYKP